MTAKDLFAALGDINEEYIKEAEEYCYEKRRILPITVVTACLCLIFIFSAAVIPAIKQGGRVPGTSILDTTAATVDDTPLPEKKEVGGINGKINVTEDLTITGEEFTVSDSEAYEYILRVKDSIANDLIASGVPISELNVTKKGYSCLRTGNDGNSLAVNWRNYIAYDGDSLVAIIQITKDNTGLHHYISFGGPWFERYGEILRENTGRELVYLYIGDVEAFITPDNTVVPLQDTDMSETLEEDIEYYSYFKTEYNVYRPTSDVND